MRTSFISPNLPFKKSYKVNTSNPIKLLEFKKYLGSDIITEQKDLAEPEADPITVVQYKASQFKEVLVDDTSLDVTNEEVGVNIRWQLEQLPRMVGRRATFVSLLGIRIAEKIHIFRGEVHGEIIHPRGTPYGFLPFFLPDGSRKTMGEEIIDEFNARFYAVKDFLEGRAFKVLPVLEKWNGKFQE